MASVARGATVGFLVVCTLALGPTGCAEKKTCFFQCYEPQLEGYRNDGNCGSVLKLTREECTSVDRGRQQPARHAWGEVPSWCSDDPERCERLLH